MINELSKEQKVSYGNGYRVCRDNGLLTKRRNPKGITKADPAARATDDLVRRDFYAIGPNEKQLTDITEMSCRDGKLYLCALLDCFDAAIVGFSMDNNMKAPLCTAALNSAYKRWGGDEGCIIHSDRGSQFSPPVCTGRCLQSRDFVKAWVVPAHVPTTPGWRAFSPR